MVGEFKVPTEAVEALRRLILSQDWETYRSFMETARETWNRLLLNRSEKRKSEYSDDYIAGCITTLESLLALPELLVHEHDASNEKTEQDKRDAHAYATRAALGRIGPFVNPDGMPTILE